MKETNVIAAVLTVAFYMGRGGAIGMPQILSTYRELRGLLAEEASPKKKRRK